MRSEVRPRSAGLYLHHSRALDLGLKTTSMVAVPNMPAKDDHRQIVPALAL